MLMYGDIVLNRKRDVRRSLEGIKGMGMYRTWFLINKIGLSKFLKMSKITKYQFSYVICLLEESFLLDTSLLYRKELNVKKTIDNGSYRGLRCLQRLPGHGQRTRANGETSKKKRKFDEPLSKRARKIMMRIKGK